MTRALSPVSALSVGGDEPSVCGGVAFLKYQRVTCAPSCAELIAVTITSWFCLYLVVALPRGAERPDVAQQRVLGEAGGRAGSAALHQIPGPPAPVR